MKIMYSNKIIVNSRNRKISNIQDRNRKWVSFLARICIISDMILPILIYE